VPVEIRILTEAEIIGFLDDFANTLRDAVAGGASVSFIEVPTSEEARAFWTSVAQMVAAGACLVIGAFDEGRLLGTVQLHPSDKPNQPHRGDVAKLLVLRNARRRGVATALMQGIERIAKERGIILLTLDTWTGQEAERLYLALGWTRVGVIPGYAIGTDRQPVDTTIFYKTLAS
jgi:GNAT superfamily N-acetyltransferase